MTIQKICKSQGCPLFTMLLTPPHSIYNPTIFKLRPNQLYITQGPNQERDSNSTKVWNKTLALDPFWNPKSGAVHFASLFKIQTSSISQINMNQMPGSLRSAKLKLYFNTGLVEGVLAPHDLASKSVITV